jgi:N-acetylneuraminic acid mutarotase
VLISILLFLEIYPNLIAVSNAQGQTRENGWMKGAPMPNPRTEVIAASLDDDVYVIGGFTSDGMGSSLVEMYNSTADSWKTDVAPLPVPLHHASAVTFDDKIYVVGGYSGVCMP